MGLHAIEIPAEGWHPIENNQPIKKYLVITKFFFHKMFLK